MKISTLIWMMVLTVSVVGSTTGIASAQGGPPADPPGKPLTSVSHDGSLTGNGTTASPLGINTGAVVTAVTVSAPLVSSGGSTPNISLPGVIITSGSTAPEVLPGSGNTAIGNNALTNNTIGAENTASGFGALGSNTTGGQNTADGFGALLTNTTGGGNTASGWAALGSNTTGGANTATGLQALSSNTTGDDNTADGFGALLSNTTGGANTASGLQALASNTTGFNNTASGLTALYKNTTGDNNTASGFGALGSNTTGGQNTAVGFSADVGSGNLTNATAIGAEAVVNASNKIRLGNFNVTVIEGQVAYTFTSDATKKENFRPVNGEDVLRKIGKFNLTSWNYIGHEPQEFRHYGPMAQDFYASFGHDEVGTIGTPTTINSGDMEGILMIAVQALEKRTAEQREEMETLKAENATLKALLESMRK